MAPHIHRFSKKISDVKLSQINAAQDLNWIEKAIYYSLDWKNKIRSTRLKNWLKSQMESEKLLEIVNEYKLKEIENEDERAIRILKLVYYRIKYTSDSVYFGTTEYWQKAEDTWNNRYGDCEDSAILILILCRLSGIPSNRIRLCAGSVEGGGHAWVRYIPREYPFTPVFLDAAYWPSLSSLENRKFYFDFKYSGIIESKLSSTGWGKSVYKQIWFQVNDEGEWIMHQINQSTRAK